MERLNFVKNGVLRLPPGFRFHPTDEELVLQYLKRKVFSCPLPASIIPEVEVCKADPWDLPGLFHISQTSILLNWFLLIIIVLYQTTMSYAYQSKTQIVLTWKWS